MKYNVFVDGQEGTTGLEINERIEKHRNVNIIHIVPEKRKDPKERSKLINESDITFLCLPDAAAEESASFVHNNRTRLIDASTAHRVSDDWAYGFPELGGSFRTSVRNAMKVSVPGCYATGFNALLYPLIKEGIVPNDYPVSCHAVSGYSGGGKKLIAKYESADAAENLGSPCLYSLGLKHKHIPEMQKVCGLMNPPLFTPIVGNFYRGMTVAVPLFTGLLANKPTKAEIYEFYAKYYKNQTFVKVMPFEADSYLDNGFLFATGCNGTNRLEVCVFGNDAQILLVSRLDNLGKGASGAAVQNMNIMLGLDEGTGLMTGESKWKH